LAQDTKAKINSVATEIKGTLLKAFEGMIQLICASHTETSRQVNPAEGIAVRFCLFSYIWESKQPVLMRKYSEQRNPTTTIKMFTLILL
jgi:hypothetical protein